MDGVIQLSGQRLGEFGRQQVCAGRAADDKYLLVRNAVSRALRESA